MSRVLNKKLRKKLTTAAEAATLIAKQISWSGKITDGQATQLLGRGFDGILRKPFSVRQVIEAIQADAIRVVFESRFGPMPTDLAAILESATEIARLETLLKQVARAVSIDELRTLWNAPTAA